MTSLTIAKRQKKEGAEEPKQSSTIIVEPVRRSLLNVLMDNLKLAKRRVFVNRLIWAAEFELDGPEDIAEYLEENCKRTNRGYNTENLSGVVLYYDRYVCNIIEGSEDTIHKYINHVLEDRDVVNLKSDIVVALVHHIQARFLNGWLSYYGRPPTLLENINPDCNLTDAMRYTENCAEKIYNFANAFVKDHIRHIDDDESDGSGSESDSGELMVFKSKSTMGSKEKDPYMEHLPELKLLEFLCHCKHFRSLSQYDSLFKMMTDADPDDYNDRVWPVPRDCVPYDVFDKPLEPIPQLTTGFEKAEILDDEELLRGSIQTEISEEKHDNK